MSQSQQVSLISRWFVKPGCEAAAMAALTEAVEAVRANEPHTLTYRVHVQHRDPPHVDPDLALQSLPPVDALSILFFEVYRDAQAFHDHVNGKVFTGFVKEHGHLFVPIVKGGGPYTTVNFLTLHAGFTRAEDKAVAGVPPEKGNRHPAVMFEIIARDQAKTRTFYGHVFGWDYDTGTDGFSYVHFPAGAPPLLGGIGQSRPDVPGFEPGHNFYLLVDALEPVLARAVAAGGSALMQPTAVDGYRFAMFRDPEGNPVGLIEPFGR